ncbi:hypothetical protein Tco_0534538 [Tanacetum coccineum]
MAALVSCPKHNMVACLEKMEQNTQFHEINTATSKTVNDVSYIKAKVAGKTVSISEASIRRDLLFHDVDGIDYLTNYEIYENLQLMGTYWDQFPTNIASALICLATDRKFNFSKMIFEGMLRNLDAKKQLLMYSRFVQVFLNNQLSNLPAPLDNLTIPVFTKKVFTNMAKQGLHFLGHVIPLFPNMLAQAVVDEGEGLEQPTEPQPTPSLTQPSTRDQPPVTESSYRPDTTQDPRVNLEGTSGSQEDYVQIPHDSPLSGGHTFDRAEGGLNLDELLVLYTNLSNRILVFFKTGRSVLTLKPLPSIDPKDKRKGILVEEETCQGKRKDQGIDQIERDEGNCLQDYHEEDLAEMTSIQDEKVAQEEAFRVAILEMFDEVQAGIDADALFTAKLQQEEREEYTIEERAKSFS